MSSLPRLVLASRSPRRNALLGQCGLRFRIQPSRVDEIVLAGESPGRRAHRLSREKARTVAARLRSPAWVIGCDTLVAIGNAIMEKPRDDVDAARMLHRLAGRWHDVFSGVSLVPVAIPGARAMHGLRRTRVRFGRLSPRQIRWILAAGEHHDKAGAYAIQGRAGAHVREIAGSPSNVIGLPLDLTVKLLERAGYLADTPARL